MRQLIFALDGAEWQLVQKWSKEGKLPAFTKLMNEGTFSTLKGTADQFPDSVWPCLCASSTPAKFPRYFYAQYDAKIQNLELLDDIHYSSDLDFRAVLSHNGIKVGSMDIPKDYLVKNLNGFQVLNWGCHGAKGKKCSMPESLVTTIEKKFGSHPSGDCDAISEKEKDQKKLFENLLIGIERRTEIYKYLIQEQEWQVLFLGFSEAHCAGHHFWKFMNGHQNKVLQDALQKIYIMIDDSIGQLVSLVDSETICLIVSAHGMGSLCHASWNLDEILDLLGYGEKNYKIKQQKNKVAKINPWLLLKIGIPPSIQYFIKKMLPRSIQNELIFRWYSGNRNWKNRKAFTVPNNDSVSAIRINLKNRDRYGIVQQQEYHKICNEIKSKLEQLTDPDSNQKIVSNVCIIREAFEGPFINKLPDITIHWNSSFYWNKVFSPDFGTLLIKKQDNRTGSHTKDGFFIVRGKILKQRSEPYSILDIAPTILHNATINKTPNTWEGNFIME